MSITRIPDLRDAITDLRKRQTKADPGNRWLYDVYVRQIEDLIELEEITQELES